MTKEERWRLEGLAFCLRTLEQNGNDVEALKAEIRRRGAGSIPLALSRADENRFCKAVRENCLDTVLIMTLAVLHDTFGFGRIRANRFKTAFNQAAKYLQDDCINWTEIRKGLEEQLGMVIGIRWANGHEVRNPSEKEEGGDQV